jgi:hypothetical protein
MDRHRRVARQFEEVLGRDPTRIELIMGDYDNSSALRWPELGVYYVLCERLSHGGLRPEPHKTAARGVSAQVSFGFNRLSIIADDHAPHSGLQLALNRSYLRRLPNAVVAGH